MSCSTRLPLLRLLPVPLAAISLLATCAAVDAAAAAALVFMFVCAADVAAVACYSLAAHKGFVANTNAHTYTHTGPPIHTHTVTSTR